MKTYDDNSKCPMCGSDKFSIRYELGRLQCACGKCYYTWSEAPRAASGPETYPAMNEEIANILRISGEEVDLYAANYIEQLRADNERLRQNLAKIRTELALAVGAL